MCCDVQDLRPRSAELQPHDPLQQLPPALATRPQRSEAAEREADALERCAAAPLLDHLLHSALLRSQRRFMQKAFTLPLHSFAPSSIGTWHSARMQPQHQQFQIRWSALLLPGAPLQGVLQLPPQCWPPCYRTLQRALVAAHLPQMAPALQVLRLDALHCRHARPCIATSLPTPGSDRRPAHL